MGCQNSVLCHPGKVRGSSAARAQGRAEAWEPGERSTLSTPFLPSPARRPCREGAAPALSHCSPVRAWARLSAGVGDPGAVRWSHLGSGVECIPGARGSAQGMRGTDRSLASPWSVLSQLHSRVPAVGLGPNLPQPGRWAGPVAPSLRRRPGPRAPGGSSALRAASPLTQRVPPGTCSQATPTEAQGQRRLSAAPGGGGGVLAVGGGAHRSAPHAACGTEGSERQAPPGDTRGPCTTQAAAGPARAAHCSPRTDPGHWNQADAPPLATAPRPSAGAGLGPGRPGQSPLPTGPCKARKTTCT